VAELKTKLDAVDVFGQKLIKSSSRIRADDIKLKITRLRGHWARIESRSKDRLKKLEDTLRTVQQLDRNMQQLRQWLIATEHNLTSPLVYQLCDFEEMENHIQAQHVRLHWLHIRIKHSYLINNIFN